MITVHTDADAGNIQIACTELLKIKLKFQVPNAKYACLGFGKPVTKGMIKAVSSAKERSCSRTKDKTIFGTVDVRRSPGKGLAACFQCK